MKTLAGLFALMFCAYSAKSFALLGPYDDWMQPANGFRLSDDIGGPRNLGEEYRWNVPVITYAFDQSFVEYFGSNGVAAVEEAIQILNALPPASQLDPSAFQTAVIGANFLAQSEGLMDLKSMTLSLLLEQLGLAQPTRFAFCLRDFTSSGGEIVGTVIQRNFDPLTHSISGTVNDNLYAYQILTFGDGLADAVEFPVNPLSEAFNSVADRALSNGAFFSGLSFDDVGGLGYLLTTNNINFEDLLPEVHGVGPDGESYVKEALRPGVDKITFVRPDFDVLTGQFFMPFTNQFTDKYITNNIVVEQELERVITQPDIVFSVAIPSAVPQSVLCERTGTSDWSNRGLGGTNGPGVIVPPVKITFNTAIIKVTTADDLPEGFAALTKQSWGSFDSSTNTPIRYPSESATADDLSIHMQFHTSQSPRERFVWNLNVPKGSTAVLQSSTNLATWTTLTSITNQGVPVLWDHFRSITSSQRFFRVLPE